MSHPIIPQPSPITKLQNHIIYMMDWSSVEKEDKKLFKYFRNTYKYLDGLRRTEDQQ